MNNRPVVRFDGAQYLDAGDVLDLGTNDMQIFAVIRTANSDDYNYFLSKSYPGSVPYRFGLSTHGGFPRMLFVVQGNTQLPVVGTSFVSDNTPYILEFSCDRDSSLDLRVNGMLESTRDISAYASNDFQIDVPFRIGGYVESDKISLRIPYTGDIAEIIIYHRILSTEERESVEQYLGNKWLGWSDTIQIYSNHLIADEIIERDFMEGGSISFDGLDDGAHIDRYVQIQTPVNTISTNWTVEYWVYWITGHRWDSGILTNNTSGPQIYYFGGAYVGGFSIVNDGMRFDSLLNLTGSYAVRTSVLPYSVKNSWHHFAITYDGENLIHYLDGIPISTFPVSGYLRTGTNKMSLGYYTTYWMEGKMSELRIWNITRTQEEISRDMKIRLKGNENGLIFYMPLNDGEGDTVKEIVNGNNGTLINTSWSDYTPPIPTHIITRNHELISSEFIERDYLEGGSPYFNSLRDGIHIDTDMITTHPVGTELSTNFTIEWWVKRDNGHRWHNDTLGRPTSSGMFQGFGGLTNYIWISGSTALRTDFNLTGSSVARSATLPRSITNSWHHFAITYDGNTLIYYLDGEEFERYAVEGYLRTGTMRMTIGHITTYWLEGNMSDIRIWNITRTSEEILNNMNRRMNGDEEGLIFYMPLGDEDTEIVRDIVGGNHATCTNMQWNHENPFIDADLTASSLRVTSDGIHSCNIREHYPTDIVTDGLVLWLDGDDFSNVPQTTKWVDRSGMGNHAIASGFAYTQASGSDGFGGVNLDGADDYFRIPNHPSLEPTEATIEFRFTPRSFTSYPSIICKRAANTIGYFVFLTGGTLSFDWGGNGKRWETGHMLTLNQEVTVTLTSDSSGRKLYIDGILSKSTTSIGDPNLVPCDSDIFISRNAIASDYFVNGNFKYIRMYNRALSAEEILKNYNASG
jgi:hypothetical protein